LYWIKFREDLETFFIAKPSNGQAAKHGARELIPMKMKMTESEIGETLSEKDKKSDKFYKENDRLQEYLLAFYLKISPQLADSDSGLFTLANVSTTRYDELRLHGYYKHVAHALINVDEYVNFKKYLVATFHSEKDKITQFLEQNFHLK